MVPRSEGVYHANLVVVVGPLAGWRHIAVTEQRTKADCAKELRYLADEAYPDAESNRLWQDTLAAYSLAVLYEVFPPAKACRRARRFAVHSTPKHGTGLTMDEIESSAFEPGCPSATLYACIQAWTHWNANAPRRAVPSSGGSPPIEPA